jgi:acetyl-CoA carboxylase biotin carboxyl carrier protein
MPEELRAEMGANVWKILVKVGDSLGEDDVVMILESMKMEIPVLAEDGGTVESIAVAEGDTVQPGALLAVLE